MGDGVPGRPGPVTRTAPSHSRWPAVTVRPPPPPHPPPREPATPALPLRWEGLRVASPPAGPLIDPAGALQWAGRTTGPLQVEAAGPQGRFGRTTGPLQVEAAGPQGRCNPYGKTGFASRQTRPADSGWRFPGGGPVVEPSVEVRPAPGSESESDTVLDS